MNQKNVSEEPVVENTINMINNNDMQKKKNENIL
jgi:hypothetical protein